MMRQWRKRRPDQRAPASNIGGIDRLQTHAPNGLLLPNVNPKGFIARGSPGALPLLALSQRELEPPARKSSLALLEGHEGVKVIPVVKLDHTNNGQEQLYTYPR